MKIHLPQLLLFLLLPPLFLPLSAPSLTLNCDFNYNFDWLIIGRVYTCTANSTFVNHDSNTSVTSVQGEHRLFKDNSDVKGLFILKKELFYLPSAIGANFFRQISGLTLNDSKLKQIQSKNLAEFPKLREIFIVSNQIETLEANLFEFNELLELVWIEGNRIVTIEADIFDNLNKLWFINIRERKSCVGNGKKVQYDRDEAEKFIRRVLKRKC